MLDHAYAVNKWTIRVLLGHIIDSHIVILYRILSITRGDKNPLPGGNQDLWASFSGYEKAGKDDLLQGYRKAANLSEWLVNGIPEKFMKNKGIANGFIVTVRDLHAYLIAHERHHKRIAKEKCGVKKALRICTGLRCRNEGIGRRDENSFFCFAGSYGWVQFRGSNQEGRRIGP